MRSDWKVSIRRACSTLRIDRALYVYKSKRGDQAALKGRIKDICETRVRYGYRRVHVLLQRDGWAINVKRVYRLYRELSLQLRNKTPKRRVKAKLREDRTEARQINETWAMDFVHDQLATGRKIRVLTIVDTFSRFSPAVDPRFSYRGEDVVLTLAKPLVIPRRSASTRDRSSSPAISTSGLTRRVSCWISRDRANRRTTAKPKDLNALDKSGGRNTDRFDGVYDRSTGAVLHRNSPHSGDTLQSKRHDARWMIATTSRFGTAGLADRTSAANALLAPTAHR